MHHFVLRTRRAGLGAVFKTQEHDHLGIECLAVEFERFVTASVEEEIRLHYLKRNTFGGGHDLLMEKNVLTFKFTTNPGACRTSFLRVLMLSSAYAAKPILSFIDRRLQGTLKNSLFANSDQPNTKSGALIRGVCRASSTTTKHPQQVSSQARVCRACTVYSHATLLMMAWLDEAIK
jgi:hypothetical protein